MADVLAEVLRAVELLRAEVVEVRRELARLRQEVCLIGSAPPGFPPSPPSAAAPQYVTLDQMAAVCHLRKRSLERYRPRLPAPKVKGGVGRPARWDWAEARPRLEEAFGVKLPEVFPAFG